MSSSCDSGGKEVDREGSVCVFCRVSFQGAISQSRGQSERRRRNETSASLFFRENGLDAILARARFLSRGWQTGRERRGDVLADRRVSFRASSAVPTPRGDRVSSRTFMMVAPSFEMVVTPLSSCTSLSKPRGPCAIGGHRGQRKYEIERAPEPLAGGSAARASSSATYQGGSDGVHHRHARVDVGNQLALALAGVRALAQEHDLGLLEGRGRGRQPRKAQIAATGNEKDLAARASARAPNAGRDRAVPATKRAARREERPHVRSSARWASA